MIRGVQNDQSTPMSHVATHGTTVMLNPYVAHSYDVTRMANSPSDAVLTYSIMLCAQPDALTGIHLNAVRHRHGLKNSALATIHA
jgi:hypothetical protein